MTTHSGAPFEPLPDLPLSGQPLPYEPLPDETPNTVKHYLPAKPKGGG